MISFEELKDQERRQREADLEQLESFAIAAADGNEVDSGQLLATLRVCGKSVDEFQQTVTTITRRRQLKATVDTIPAIRKRIVLATADIERAKEAFTESVTMYSALDSQLTAQLANIQSELNTATEAERELRNSAPQWLQDQRKQLAAELGALRQQRDDVLAKVSASETVVRENSRIVAQDRASGRVGWEADENLRISQAEEELLETLRGQSVELAAQIRAVEASISECEVKFTDTL